MKLEELIRSRPMPHEIDTTVSKDRAKEVTDAYKRWLGDQPELMLWLIIRLLTDLDRLQAEIQPHFDAMNAGHSEEEIAELTAISLVDRSCDAN